MAFEVPSHGDFREFLYNLARDASNISTMLSVSVQLVRLAILFLRSPSRPGTEALVSFSTLAAHIILLLSRWETISSAHINMRDSFPIRRRPFVC